MRGSLRSLPTQTALGFSQTRSSCSTPGSVTAFPCWRGIRSSSALPCFSCSTPFLRKTKPLPTGSCRTAPQNLLNFAVNHSQVSQNIFIPTISCTPSLLPNNPSSCPLQSPPSSLILPCQKHQISTWKLVSHQQKQTEERCLPHMEIPDLFRGIGETQKPILTDPNGGLCSVKCCSNQHRGLAGSNHLH